MNGTSMMTHEWTMLAAGQGTSISVLHHFVVDGGPITWFVLIPLSVISIALMIHYLFTIRKGTQTPAALAKALISSARQGQARNTQEITRDDETMLGRSAGAAMSHLPNGRDAAMNAAAEAVEEQAGRLLRRIEYLNVIGNVSPMIGLLGTVA